MHNACCVMLSLCSLLSAQILLRVSFSVCELDYFMQRLVGQTINTQNALSKNQTPNCLFQSSPFSFLDDQQQTKLRSSVKTKMKGMKSEHYKTKSTAVPVFTGVFTALSMLIRLLGGTHRHFKQRSV